MASIDRTRGHEANWHGPVVGAHPLPTIDRVLLTRREAAAALGMSLSHFQRHVQPLVPCVYSGQLRLYRPADLEQWSDGAVSIPNRR